MTDWASPCRQIWINNTNMSRKDIALEAMAPFWILSWAAFAFLNFLPAHNALFYFFPVPDGAHRLRCQAQWSVLYSRCTQRKHKTVNEMNLGSLQLLLIHQHKKKHLDPTPADWVIAKGKFSSLFCSCGSEARLHNTDGRGNKKDRAPLCWLCLHGQLCWCEFPAHTVHTDAK